MTTSTTAATKNDREKVKDLIFKDNDFIDKISADGLVLLVIGIDLHYVDEILAEKSDEGIQLVLALGHKDKEISKVFPAGALLEADSKSLLLRSLRDGYALDEKRSLITLSSPETTIRLHADSLLKPTALNGKVSSSPETFVEMKEGVPYSTFWSTSKDNEPIRDMDFSWSPAGCGEDEQKGGKILIIELPDGICADRQWAWMFTTENEHIQ